MIAPPPAPAHGSVYWWNWTESPEAWSYDGWEDGSTAENFPLPDAQYFTIVIYKDESDNYHKAISFKQNTDNKWYVKTRPLDPSDNVTDWTDYNDLGLPPDILTSSSATSLAVNNSNNELYIAYSPAGASSTLDVMKFNLYWEYVGSEPAPPPTNLLSFTFTLDNNNIPYEGYSDSSGNIVVKKYDESGGWLEIEGSYFSTNGANYTSISFDSNNILYLAIIEIDFYITVKKYDNIGKNWELLGDHIFNVKAQKIKLMIDNQDELYVSFQDLANNNKVTVMKYDELGTSWDFVCYPGFLDTSSFNKNLAWQTVGDSSSFNIIDPRSNIIVDTNGIVYVSAFDESENIIVIKYTESGGWEQMVDIEGPAIQQKGTPEIQVDKNNILYIGYINKNDNLVKVKKYTELGGWEPIGGTFGVFVTNINSLDFDNNDVLYVTFNEIYNFQNVIVVMKYIENSWNSVGNIYSIIEYNMCQYCTSFSFDLNNIPYVVVSSSTLVPNIICVIKYNESVNSWEFVGPEIIEESILRTSIFFNNNNIPYISFIKPITTYYGNVVIKYFENNSWNDIDVSLITENVSDCYLRYDRLHNFMYITYQEQNNKNIYIYKLNNSQIEQVGEQPLGGINTLLNDLSIDIQGNLYILYNDVSAAIVPFVVKKYELPHFSPLDTTLDTSGNPIVAVIDESSNQASVIELVDSNAIRGSYNYKHFTYNGDKYVLNVFPIAAPAVNIETVGGFIYKLDNDNLIDMSITENFLTAVNGPVHCDVYEIDGITHISVANMRDTSGNWEQNSHIYTVTGTFPNMITGSPYEFATVGAVHMESFEIDSVDYIFVVQYRDNSGNYNINSTLYLHDSVPSLTSLQSIPTNGARHAKYFKVDTDHYLAIANFGGEDGTGGVSVESKIYKWNTVTNLFNEYLSVSTTSIVKWIYLKFDNKLSPPGRHYLISANNREHVDYPFTSIPFTKETQVDSVLYIWDTTQISGSELVKVIEIPTKASLDWTPFVINSKQYLAVSNNQQNPSYYTPSVVYELGEGSGEVCIYLYSFAISPEDHQPSGTCNFSRIKNPELHLELDTIHCKIRVYATNYNLLTIKDGMAGVKYSN